MFFVFDTFLRLGDWNSRSMGNTIAISLGLLVGLACCNALCALGPKPKALKPPLPKQINAKPKTRIANASSTTNLLLKPCMSKAVLFRKKVFVVLSFFCLLLPREKRQSIITKQHNTTHTNTNKLQQQNPNSPQYTHTQQNKQQTTKPQLTNKKHTNQTTKQSNTNTYKTRTTRQRQQTKQTNNHKANTNKQTQKRNKTQTT